MLYQFARTVLRAFGLVPEREIAAELEAIHALTEATETHEERMELLGAARKVAQCGIRAYELEGIIARGMTLESKIIRELTMSKGRSTEQIDRRIKEIMDGEYA